MFEESKGNVLIYLSMHENMYRKNTHKTPIQWAAYEFF
jgi:hypothetical protein